MYFGFEIDALDGAVDNRGLAGSRGGCSAEEVDEARGFRCMLVSGFARLAAEGSEAGGANEEELLPESGKRNEASGGL